MRRPTGITILAILAIIVGLFNLIPGLVSLGIGGTLGTLFGVGPGVGAVGGLALFGGFVALISGLLYLAFGIGAWNLQGWAWTLGVVAQFIALIGHIMRLVGGNTSAGTIIGLLVAAGILIYLFQPHVRRAFGRTEGVV